MVPKRFDHWTTRAGPRKSKGHGSTPGPPFRFQVTTSGKLFTHVSLSPSIINWYRCQRAMMPYGWEGNRRSGVALAMRHRLQWFIHLWAQWLMKGRWAPRLHSSKEYGTLYLTISSQTVNKERREDRPLHWHSWLAGRKDIRHVKKSVPLIPSGSALEQEQEDQREIWVTRFTWKNGPLKWTVAVAVCSISRLFL